jgi:hypothetical protein
LVYQLIGCWQSTSHGAEMDIYGRWDWRILAVLIIGGLIAGWLIG